MKHSFFPNAESGAPRSVEHRLIHLLRLWSNGAEGTERVWSDLLADLGPGRARPCMLAIEELMALLARHGWQVPEFQAPGTLGYCAQETDLARFVMAATEQRREDAMQHALLLAAPAGLMDLMRCAEKIGLPLLCADCRSRVCAAASATPLTFQ